jgi:tetratricopeptide (TPR) repeat protein
MVFEGKILLFIATLFLLLTGCGPNTQALQEARIESLIHSAVHSDSTGDLKASVKYYSEILKLDSTKLIALINRGRALVTLGKVKAGFEDYDKAVKLYPEEHTLSARGMSFCIVKDYKNANADFKKAIAHNPKFSQAYYGLCLVRIADKQFSEALALCNVADYISCIPGFSKAIRAEIQNKQIDFKLLYGKWLPISTHKGSDSTLSAFLKDTISYDYKHPTFTTFDSTGKFHDLEGDYGTSGSYKLDTLKGYITRFREYKGGVDTINRVKIIYLDNAFLLTEIMYRKERYVHFYKKTKMADVHWGG